MRKRYKEKGYWLIYMPDNPEHNNHGYIREHRYILSLKLGRPLKKSESVHHINGKRDDNRPENLQLLTHSEHSTLENKKRKSYLNMVEKRGRVWNKGKDFGKKCTVANCGRKHWAKGLCSRHYDRLRYLTIKKI